MAHIPERVSLLLSAHWFCYSHCFPSQSKLSHLAWLPSPQITHLFIFGPQTVFRVTLPFFFLLQDDRYFLSGSLDGKLRLWNIPDKKVALWNEVDGQTRLITAANFCQNGKYAVIGTYDGRCIFYDTEVLNCATSANTRCHYDLLSVFCNDWINFCLYIHSLAPEISHSNSCEVHQRQEQSRTQNHWHWTSSWREQGNIWSTLKNTSTVCLKSL